MLQNLQLLLFLHRPETLKGSSKEQFFRCPATNNTVAYRQLKTGITEISTKGGGVVWVNTKPTFRDFGIWGNFFFSTKELFYRSQNPKKEINFIYTRCPTIKGDQRFFYPQKAFFGVLDQQRECLNKCFQWSNHQGLLVVQPLGTVSGPTTRDFQWSNHQGLLVVQPLGTFSDPTTRDFSDPTTRDFQ